MWADHCYWHTVVVRGSKHIGCTSRTSLLQFWWWVWCFVLASSYSIHYRLTCVTAINNDNKTLLSKIKGCSRNESRWYSVCLVFFNIYKSSIWCLTVWKREENTPFFQGTSRSSVALKNGNSLVNNMSKWHAVCLRDAERKRMGPLPSTTVHCILTSALSDWNRKQIWNQETKANTSSTITC